MENFSAGVVAPLRFGRALVLTQEMEGKCAAGKWEGTGTSPF